jgi:hypothetical protein
MTVRSLVGTAHGLAARTRRRGSTYVGQLLGSAAWPKVAYRFGWGPSAPPLLQGLFAAAGELAATRIDLAELQRLGLAVGAGTTVEPAAPPPAEVERLMDRAHAAGITGVRHSFSHLVRGAGGALAFGDLTKARKHQPHSIHFMSSREADREAFNKAFGTSIPIHSGGWPPRGGLGAVRQARRGGTGSHTAAGPAAGRRGGTGADGWSAFLAQVVAPLVAGKRVLDLGSSVGSVPLALLQAGAREVIAVELSRRPQDITGMTTSVISWRDVEPYDTQVGGDLRDVLAGDRGRFDVITGFGALHYWPESHLRDVVSRAAAMSTVLIFQAHDVIESLPATTLNLHRLMRDHGYEIQLHTIAGRDGPLLIGVPQSISTGR